MLSITYMILSCKTAQGFLPRLLVCDSLQSFDVLHLCNHLPYCLLSCNSTYLILALCSFKWLEGQALHFYMSLQKEHGNSADNVKTSFALSCHCIFLYHICVKSLSMNILSIVAPAGIIGKMFSLPSTHASRKNGPSVESIFSIA